MKTSIDVTSRTEADAIKVGLDNPTLRAIVTVTGILSALAEPQRTRVLAFVTAELEAEK